MLCPISLAPAGHTPSSNIDAGIMVLSSAPLARKLSVDIPAFAVPEPIIDMIERDRMAGMEIDCDLIGKIHESGAFDGIYLGPITHYRETAVRLEGLL